MTMRQAFVSVFVLSLLTGGLLSIAAANTPAAAAPFSVAPGKSAQTNVVRIKRRRRSRVKIRLPRGPSYIYYDYPYYYSRGFYPTHIGGYIYYPHIPTYYSRYRDRCPKGRRHCSSRKTKKKGYRSRRLRRKRK